MIAYLPTDLDSAFRDVCRANNWRRTAQRRAVFVNLCGNRDHPSVETVWHLVQNELPDVSLDSIYRILDEFAAAGLIRRLESNRCLRYDPDTDPHAHFSCISCGRLYDFPCPEAKAIATSCRHLGDAETVEVHVRGLCEDCRP